MYRPVAEMMLSLVSQISGLPLYRREKISLSRLQTSLLHSQRHVIAQRVLGATFSAIAKSKSISRERVRQLEQDALRKLSRLHVPLVSEYLAVRKAELSYEEIKARKRLYSQRPEVKRRQKQYFERPEVRASLIEYHQNYYWAHKNVSDDAGENLDRDEPILRIRVIGLRSAPSYFDRYPIASNNAVETRKAFIEGMP
jgi:hypothetical protein